MSLPIQYNKKGSTKMDRQ